MLNSEPSRERPPWLKVRWTQNDNFQAVQRMINGLKLHTVCQEAKCPNIFECWGEHRTATFMILGDQCTRHCTYCAVASSKQPQSPDPEEPVHVAEAIAHLGLRHAVITSVDRDDLPDGGASHFAETMQAVRRAVPDCRVEVLIPDFNGDERALEIVLQAHPDVLAHNIETVRRIFPRVRRQGDYDQSMELLRRTSTRAGYAGRVVKSGIMVGLGESLSELEVTMADLRTAGCVFVTIGQYLRPTPVHAPIDRYYSPEEFDRLADLARNLGFRFVESGPLVRSSYHAHMPFTVGSE